MAKVCFHRWEELIILGLLKISRVAPCAFPQIFRMLCALPPSLDQVLLHCSSRKQVERCVPSHLKDKIT